MDDITRQVATLEARTAIGDLVHQYALNIRAGKGADCTMLFTEDAVFTIREKPFGSDDQTHTRSRLEGRDAILGHLEEADASGARLCPVIHNLMISVDGDTAFSSCLMQMILPEQYQIVGEYEDHYRYQGRWLFTSRTFTIFV